MNKLAFLLGLVGCLMASSLHADSLRGNQAQALTPEDYKAALESFGVESEQAKAVADAITSQIAEQRAQQARQQATKDPFAEVTKNLLQ